jgi:hypothetical protein
LPYPCHMRVVLGDVKTRRCKKCPGPVQAVSWAATALRASGTPVSACAGVCRSGGGGGGGGGARGSNFALQEPMGHGPWEKMRRLATARATRYKIQDTRHERHTSHKPQATSPSPRSRHPGRHRPPAMPAAGRPPPPPKQGDLLCAMGTTELDYQWH